jgi:hypothetical protein
MSCFDRNTSILAGVDDDMLRTWLSQAQAARMELSTGSRAVTVEVTGGGQHRSVTYRNDQNGLAMLDDWIRLLQAQLGIIRSPRRRATIGYH